VREPLYDFYDGYTGVYNRALRALGGVCEAPDAPCDSMPEGIERVFARGSFVYIISANDGVVLVDTGFERDGASLLAAIGEREVLAVLITHAHPDHTEAAHLFDAPVYVGRADASLWRSEILPEALFSLAAQRTVGLAPLPENLVEVDDGFSLEVGGKRFSALAVPGHTPGSVVWRHDDLAFTGDAMVNPTGQRLIPTPSFTTDDLEAAWRRFEHLADDGAAVILDGHYGRTDYAEPALRDALSDHHHARESFRAYLDAF